MPARRPFVVTEQVKAQMRRFIHEAEDLVVFAPDPYKKKTFSGMSDMQTPEKVVQAVMRIVLCFYLSILMTTRHQNAKLFIRDIR
jgi:hypothetical protein